MVWSNWRGAVVVMLAWVGLAWSQAPEPASSVDTAERIMTVHENGKGVRCRVVSTWHTQAGTAAYQLQVLDSGEMMTIIESGHPATIHEPLAGKMKALPMRIFHWGRNRVSPPGVPLPSETIMTAGSRGNSSGGCDQCQGGSAPIANNGGPAPRAPGKDQILWWEEKDGKQVSPTIVTNGNNPFEQPAATTPGAPRPYAQLPVVVEQNGSPVRPLPAGVPIVVDPRQPLVVNSQPEPKTGTSNTTPGVVQTGPAVPVPQTNPVTVKPSPRPQGPYVQIGPTSLPNTIKSATSGQPTNKNNTQPQGPLAQIDTTKPANQTPPSMAVPQPATTQAGPSTRPTMVTESPSAKSATEPPSTNAAAATSTKPQVAAPKAPARLTVGQKIQNWLNPKRETAGAQPTDPKKVASTEKAKETAGADASSKTPANRVPFSTAAAGTVKSTPPPAGPKGPASPEVAPITQEKVDDKRPVVQVPPKKDWRTMWGQPKEAKTEVPGKSMVDQASAKPGPKADPLVQIPATLPPTSKVEKNADILMNPEKFDPNGSKLSPKGINMNAYRGDPTKALERYQPTGAQQSLAQNSAPGAYQTWTQNPAGPPPQFTPNDGRLPLGAQSVLAAGGNVPSRMTYVPVPVATVPNPYRPPLPPAAQVPEPPQPNAYVNAFSPGAPPQDKQPQNPMTMNAFSNMNPQGNPGMMAQGYPQVPGYGPNPYLPNPNQPNPMAQGYPVAPGYPPNPNMMVAQGAPNPYYFAPQAPAQQTPMMSPQGRPVAQTNYPQNYQGPQPPSPYTQQMQQPVQPIQYSPAPMPQPAINQAMDRRVGPGAAGPSPELVDIIKVLRESPYPAQREWASNTMAIYDWRAHPEVVQVLLQGAQQDPAATVRASCVYSLGRMNAASEPVLSILYTLRNDGDPRVRQEVEQSLVRLGVNRQ